MKENICICCKKKYEYKGNRKTKYCSIPCQLLYQYKEWISSWKKGEKHGVRGKSGNIAQPIRRYLFEKYKNKCCRCHWNKVNQTTKKIPLQVNHIDGNHTNNKEENLELLCPNCHSLTDNYGNLNIGKGRKERY